MKKAITTYTKPVVAILTLILLAILVGGYILGKQRLTLPAWVPAAGSDFVTYKAQVPTAQAITPGQGQTVNVAGVPVGEITKVNLVDGRAVVSFKIQRKYSTIYKDATVLVRPRTGLNDMLLELSPGSRAAGELPKNGKGQIPVSQTLSPINFDEVLAGLDGDTRTYLKLLLGGAGEGLDGEGQQLSATFKRIEPLNRDLGTLTSVLAQRRGNLKRTITNLRKLTEAVGSKDQQLSQLVDSSNAVFRAFANQETKLRETLDLLPGTLQTANVSLKKANTLAEQLKPTLGNLRPAARALGPTLKQQTPFLKETTPIIKDQLRPFARDVRPAVDDLKPAAADLAAATPDLATSFGVLSSALRIFAYDEDGAKADKHSYLYWAMWAGHLANDVFKQTDANGPVRRGSILTSCSALRTLSAVKSSSPQIGLAIDLLNPPFGACGVSANPATVTPGATATTPGTTATTPAAATPPAASTASAPTATTGAKP